MTFLQVCPRRQRRLGGVGTPSLVRRGSQWPAASLPNSLQVEMVGERMRNFFCQTSLQSREVSLGSCSQGALYITTQKVPDKEDK